MLPPAILQSLVLKAARCLEQLMDTAESESVRANAALGILRLAERSERAHSPPAPSRSPRPSSPRRAPAPPPPPAAHENPAPQSAPDNVSPAQPDTAPPASESVPSQPSAAASESLSESEALELCSIYPHLDPLRVRRAEFADMWRNQLDEGRFWRNHWASLAAKPKREEAS